MVIYIYLFYLLIFVSYFQFVNQIIYSLHMYGLYTSLYLLFVYLQARNCLFKSVVWINLFRVYLTYS